MHDVHIRKMHPDVFAQNMHCMLRDFCYKTDSFGASCSCPNYREWSAKGKSMIYTIPV